MPRTSNKGEEILRFIQEQTEKKGYPPSVREICEAVDLRSTSTVHAQLKKLEQRGFLAKDDLKTRALKLTDLYYETYGASRGGDVLSEKEFDAFYEKQADTEYLQVPVLGGSRPESRCWRLKRRATCSITDGFCVEQGSVYADRAGRVYD